MQMTLYMMIQRVKFRKTLGDALNMSNPDFSAS
jgi:hypothetical protein